MEKRPLTPEELDQLEQQYYELTEELRSYRNGMRDRDYKAKFPKQEREHIKRQYKFLKNALNEGLGVLIDHEHLSVKTCIDVIGNPFCTLRTKWNVSKYMRTKFKSGL